MSIKIFVTIFLFFQNILCSLPDVDCGDCAITDPLLQIFANQNQCALNAQVPVQLRVPYGIYPPQCHNYDVARFSYNKRFNVFPHAIFLPNTPQDVAYLVKTLAANNLPFAIRSGGHCYEPGSLSNGYIIDLRKFDYIFPDVATQTVTIGAGLQLGKVISALAAIDYAIPTGECTSVGVSGLALGGGIGFLTHPFGLTCDAIISMKVVLATGEIVTVSADSYPDLFFALRGAGANSYGIVLELTFKMFYVPLVSFITLQWNWDRVADLPAIFNSWQEWVAVANINTTSEFLFKYQDGKSFIKVSALHVGSEPFNEWKPFFEKFNPQAVSSTQGRYAEVAPQFASSYTFNFSKVKSKFLFRPFSLSGLNVMIDFYTKLQNLGCEYLVFTEMDSLFGGVSSEGDTAYFARKAFSSLFTFIYWPRQEQSEAAINLVSQLYGALEPYTSPYSYSNLPDFELGPTYLNAYYGTKVPRLIQIKDKYDPQNVFNWRQGIPTKLNPQSNLSYRMGLKYCNC